MRFIDRLLEEGTVLQETEEFVADNGNVYCSKMIQHTNGVVFVVMFENGRPFQW